MLFKRRIYLLWEIESKARMTGPPTRILRAVATKSSIALDHKETCVVEAKEKHKSSQFFIEMTKTDTLFDIDDLA